MPKYKILCLDDDDTVVSLIKAINKRSADVEVSYDYPKPFSEQLQQITDLDKKKEIDGLMLDLRLDQSVNAKTVKADYRASTLAQELRTLATEKKISSFPIFLWSIDAKLSKSFNNDMSSQDVFDRIILKEDFPEAAADVARELVSFVCAYKTISAKLPGAHHFRELLDLKDPDLLDERIGAPFSRASKSVPLHSYAIYIFNALIDTRGPLIDEPVLCARLGIDRKKSQDFSGILHMLDKACRYQGPFCDGWPRWWWPAIEHWWLKLDKENKPISSLTASARVEILRKKLRLRRITAAKPIEKGYGQYFSTICEILKQPLDPMDGFVISPRTPYPWQDKLYLSRKAALNQARYDVRYELDPVERERLESYKKGA